jgi:hypothetical protein
MSTPVRRYERDPRQALLGALEDFIDATERRDTEDPARAYDLAWRRFLMAVRYFHRKHPNSDNGAPAIWGSVSEAKQGLLAAVDEFVETVDGLELNEGPGTYERAWQRFLVAVRQYQRVQVTQRRARPRNHQRRGPRAPPKFTERRASGPPKAAGL